MDNFYAVTGIIAALCVLAAVLAFVFIKRAVGSFGGKHEYEFVSVRVLQRRYEKIREKSLIPCSVGYIRASREACGNSETYAHLSETILATFGGDKNMTAHFGDGDFLVLTSFGEPKLILATEQIRREMIMFSGGRRTDAETMYFGAYLIPAGNIDFDEAVSRARLARDEAEKTGTGYFAWDYNLQRNHENKSQIEEGLMSGIENNNFFLEFQPIMDIQGGYIVGGEVLTRLNRDSKIMLPADFVPIVRDRELESEFDFYVLEKVCVWVQAHREICDRLRYLTVNFSRKTIAEAGFVEALTEITSKYDVPATFIAVEVLEDSDGEKFDAESAKKNLNALMRRGIMVLLDDFGEGYTSFDDLQNLPVVCIKIGKAIMDNLNTGIGVRIFNSIMNIAKNLDVAVICEGVETPEQLEILRKNECRFVQGFYFYRPMNSEQFEKLVKNNGANQEAKNENQSVRV